MAERREPSIPLPRPAPAPAPPARNRDGGARPDRGSGGVSAGWLALVLVTGLVGGVLIGVFVSDDGGVAGGDPLAGVVVDGDGFQAVTLSNDRVFFGRLRVANEHFYRLEDAYFLRESTDDDGALQRALLPTNRMLYGPESAMLVRRDEVLVVEDLASDSPILREIERQQEGGGAPPTTVEEDRSPTTTEAAPGATEGEESP